MFFRCVDSRTNTESSASLCDWTVRPADTAACHVACPGDCVLGPWSDWSPCPKVKFYNNVISHFLC